MVFAHAPPLHYDDAYRQNDAAGKSANRLAHLDGARVWVAHTLEETPQMQPGQVVGL
jgi:hypothetical protein